MTQEHDDDRLLGPQVAETVSSTCGVGKPNFFEGTDVHEASPPSRAAFGGAQFRETPTSTPVATSLIDRG